MKPENEIPSVSTSWPRIRWSRASSNRPSSRRRSPPCRPPPSATSPPPMWPRQTMIPSKIPPCFIYFIKFFQVEFHRPGKEWKVPGRAATCGKFKLWNWKLWQIFGGVSSFFSFLNFWRNTVTGNKWVLFSVFLLKISKKRFTNCDPSCQFSKVRRAELKLLEKGEKKLNFSY